MNTKTANKVKDHFHKTAEDFDAIYTGKKGGIRKKLDRMLRWDMYQRYDMTIKECDNPQGKRILDIGCGSGQFMIPLALKGAGEVVGIDFAANMIALAQQMADDQGLNGKCKFIEGDFIKNDFKKSFDIMIAIGLFDYIPDCLPYLKKIRKLTTEKLIATFPQRWTIRAPIRKVRLNLHNCPVFFFSQRDIEKLFQKAGFSNWKIQKVGKIYFTVAYV